MPVSVAVIGCGNISKFHFSGLEKAGAQVRWVCDIDPEAARPWAEKFNANLATDYQQVLADPAVDVVDITLISSLHRQICLDAITQGKAVICEKTLTENADDSLKIIQLAQARGAIFYTSYMKRFIPAVVKAKELLPDLGKILSTSMRTFQPWGPLWEVAPTTGFFSMPNSGPSEVVRRYGGGILVCGGSHMLDLVLYLFGRPTRLYARMVQPEGFDYDLQAAVLLETSNGIVHWEALAHPMSSIGYLQDGWDETIEITGARGRLTILSAKWDEVTFKASRLIYHDNRSLRTQEFIYPAVSPFDLAIDFFISNISQGQQGSQLAVTGYEVDELIAHIKKSAASHQATEIDWRI